MVPMVGAPGAVAVFTGAGDDAAVRELTASAPSWRNEMAARSLFSLIRYRPGERAGRVGMPLLVCVAEEDTAASEALAVRAARRAPRGELRRRPGAAGRPLRARAGSPGGAAARTGLVRGRPGVRSVVPARFRKASPFHAGFRHPRAAASGREVGRSA